MRLVIARCTVDYVGRLTAHLPSAPRLILVKADGSVSIHADDRAYKPLNWMSPPCTLRLGTGDEAGLWTVTNKAGERLVITVDGRPVAQLGPLEPSGSPTLADLAASGLVEPPRRTRPSTAPEPADTAVDVRLDRILTEVRGQ